MAKIDLSVNVPDDQVARLQAAMRARFGKVPSGTNGATRDMTPAELVDRMRFVVINHLKDIVRAYDRREVVEAANVKDIDAT